MHRLVRLYLRDVSIHAPREGCDPFGASFVLRVLCFNSRTPGGVRLTPPSRVWRSQRFQFTHPGRGATPPASPQRAHPTGFNSRTPGGVRLLTEERCVVVILFQFTHPGRGAT